ncbi:MAG: phosphonate ABC transporter permease [Ignavibacteriae bacterium]|nr:phosphonate ABC transporter permease [Ignavibacteriota bacterium]
MNVANFKVDTKLASILGENYRSTEYAIKELIDNSWDADSDNVNITLPEPLTKEPLVIIDDGSGMTEKEIKNEYLVIANSRYSRKGERSPLKKRIIKGRKGIGKFAGLVVANEMILISKARGKKTTLRIIKEDLLKSKKDLERVDLPITVEDCSFEDKGTTIILNELNENFSFPDEETLKQLLIIEYGRKDDFSIKVNDVLLDVDDIPGETIQTSATLNSIGNYSAKFTISTSKKKLRQPGLAVRVNGKIIGKPTFLGLENDEVIPKKLLHKVYGEIEANGLEGDVTADWGAIIENSIGYKELIDVIAPQIKDALSKTYQKEISLQQARLQKKINSELSRLPEHKRNFAQKSLDKILRKFYDESEDKINTIISVVLDAFEKDEYWVVLNEIDDAEDSEINDFANALYEFGIAELSLISQQASSRIRFLKYLQKLIDNPNTLEKDVHKAFEKNLWVLGHEYSLMTSNESLNSIIKNYTDKKYTGERANKRPDLLLNQNIFNKYLLIEFKRPSHTIVRDDENQAEKYRDDLNEFIHNEIEIFVIGGKVDSKIDSKYTQESIKLLSFSETVSKAMNQLNWLLGELKSRNAS